MAVELCKVALWIEALEPGKPLSFLDARIKCGDSLIGIFDYEMLKAGIPDDAYTAMSGDDKTVAKGFERLNKEERDGNAASGFIKSLAAPAEIVDGARKIAAMPEDTLPEVKAKARAFARYEASDQWQRLKLACDIYVASFFTPKVGEVPSARTLVDMPVPTTGAMWEALSGTIRSDIVGDNASETSERNSALHWPLAFPAVMARGGFDAVVGNPPWERIKLQEQEFFASRDTAIATAKNKAARDKLIKALSLAEKDTPEHNLFLEFEAAKRAAEAASFFVRKTGRFPLSGVGDVNTYALFAEHFSRLARRLKHSGKPSQISLLQAIADTGGVREAPAGRAGMIVPTGIATDSSTSAFFGDLVSTKRLNALYDFENRDGIFPGVHRSFKFSTLSIGPAKVANFAFFLHDVSMLEEKERRFTLSPDQIAAINPNTKTAPVFRSRADAELTAKLYSKAPVLIEERPDHPDGDKNPWGISFQRMFDMSNDSEVFEGEETLERKGFNRISANWENSDGRRYVPLYEAKMIHHYDHRWATYEGEDEEQGTRDVTLEEKQDPNFEPTPRYWVPEDEVDMRASRVPTRLKSAFKKDDTEGCLKILAEWVLGSTPGLNSQNPVASLRDIQAHLASVLGSQATSSTVVGRSLQNWLSASAPRGVEMQRYTALDQDDLILIKEYGGRWLELAGDLIDRKKPRWLMGWRDICRSSDERTVIACVYPFSGVSNKLPIMNLPNAKAIDAACMVSNLSSLTFDYVSRQKIGSTSMNYFIYKQLPLLAPDQFHEADQNFIQPRILELTYTSHSMCPWAEDLGYTGAPFAFDPDRRAQLRAELDAFFAKKYGLTKDELRYVLDPNDVKGVDYPSETFRGLKNKEIKQFGEYRTQRLVLEAFDRMTGG
jgi:hypothetical protein